MIKLYMSVFVLLVVCIWLLSCAVDPVTGKRTFMLLSENDEIRLGQSTDKQVVDMYGYYSDEPINKYIKGNAHIKI